MFKSVETLGHEGCQAANSKSVWMSLQQQNADNQNHSVNFCWVADRSQMLTTS